MFLAPDDFLLPASLREDDEQRAKQKAFRARIDKERVRASFVTPADLVIAVLKALHELDREINLESRENALNDLRSASLARCVRRWIATGFPEDKARTWSDDTGFGLPGAWLLDHIRDTRIIITGGIGSGKSLIAERLHQMAIDASVLDVRAPIPVYLTDDALMSAAADLKRAIGVASEGLGEPRVAGVALVLDGLDECGIDAAAKLLDATRDICPVWPNSQVIITSRPIPELECLTECEKRLNVPILTDEEAGFLIASSAECEYALYQIHHLEPAVRDAVHLPLFALLFGTFLRDRDYFAPKSTAEMISFVVERALRGANANVRKGLRLLMKLACECVQRNGRVPSAELGGRLDVQSVIDSRLVVEDAGMLSFALPLFGEWFAAQALAQKEISPGTLMNSNSIDRWKVPLSILAATADNEAVSHYLVPVAGKHPSLAAEVIREGLAKRALPPDVEPPPPDESGRRIRTAMQAWINGLGPLARLIAPVDASGLVLSVGVRTDGNRLTVGWCRKTGELGDVVVLDRDPWSSGSMPQNFVSIMTACPSAQPAWAWRWTHEELTNRLKEVLQKRTLPMVAGPIAREAAWETATTLCGRPRFGFDQCIPLSRIEEEMSRIQARAVSIAGPEREETTIYLGSVSRKYESAPLKAELDRLRAAGANCLHAPWPEPDSAPVIPGVGGGFFWQFYSRQALLERTNAVYSAAMEAYTQIVEEYLPTFADRLHTYALMPVRFAGVLTPPQPDQGFQGAPCLDWYFVALPKGRRNQIDIEYGPKPSHHDDAWGVMRQSISKHRSGAGWLRGSYHQEMLSIFGPKPVTDIAYGWLWGDLEAISWVDGTFSR